MMDVHEINKETNLSSDVPSFHDDKLIVSNLFSNKYASSGIKNDGLSELTAHPTFDKCDPSNNRFTKSMFVVDTKIASSASQNHNLGQYINPEPSVTKEPIKTKTLSRPILQSFEHSVTQVSTTSKESCYHQSGQLMNQSTPVSVRKKVPEIHFSEITKCNTSLTMNWTASDTIEAAIQVLTFFGRDISIFLYSYLNYYYCK